MRYREWSELAVSSSWVVDTSLALYHKCLEPWRCYLPALMLLVVSSSPNACWTCSSVRSDNLPTSRWTLNVTQALVTLLNIPGYIQYPLLYSQVVSWLPQALACLGWFRLVTSLAAFFVLVYLEAACLCICATN